MAPCVVQIGRAKTIITTTLTRLFALTHPIVLGPMGGAAGGALAAAVSNAGGLGLVGGGYGDADWLRTELAIARADTTCAWGAGFITWSATRAVLDQVLAGQPHAVVLSFGDPRPFGAVLKAAGCKLICQVQDLATAGLAREAGADLVVAQGSEGGGHGAGRGTLALALAPAVVDAVVPIPVLAAGGIADGRGLAAALMLVAQGALIGTRFYASDEALGSPRARDHIVAARGDDTTRTRVFDIVRGYHWPAPYTGRSLNNPFMARWQGREDELARALPAAADAFFAAQRAEDFDTAMVWAGVAVDLIHDVAPAALLVARLSAEAEQHLRAAAARCGAGRESRVRRAGAARRGLSAGAAPPRRADGRRAARTAGRGAAPRRRGAGRRPHPRQRPHQIHDAEQLVARGALRRADPDPRCARRRAARADRGRPAGRRARCRCPCTPTCTPASAARSG